MVGTTEDTEIGDLRITVDCPSCRPPPDHSNLLVSAAARTAGSQSSFWTSSLQLVNAGDERGHHLRRAPARSRHRAAVASYELAPGEAVILEDVVGDLVGGRGSGALRLSSTGAMAATTRTATTGGRRQLRPGDPGRR